MVMNDKIGNILIVFLDNKLPSFWNTIFMCYFLMKPLRLKSCETYSILFLENCKNEQRPYPPGYSVSSADIQKKCKKALQSS